MATAVELLSKGVGRGRRAKRELMGPAESAGPQMSG